MLAGRRVLDCFSNQGGFASGLRGTGALEVTAVESAGESARKLRENSYSKWIAHLRC